MRVHRMFNIKPILHPNEGPSPTRAEQESSDGNHLLTNHICQNFREEFYSLKSFSKHCCHGLAGARGDDRENDNSNGLFSPLIPLSRTPTLPLVLFEEKSLANCLFLLSTAPANPVLHNTDEAECSTSVLRITCAKECSTFKRREVNYIFLPPPLPQPEGPEPHVSKQIPPNVHQLFECKTCQKVFTSHTTLGGHRASHKRVSGCFATQLEIRSPKKMKYTSIEVESNNIIHQNNQAGFSHKNNQARSSSESMTLAVIPFVGTSSQFPLPNKKPKVHECSICKRQFPSGQALGGHKRCHWRASTSYGATIELMSIIATKLQTRNSISGLNDLQPHTLRIRSLICTLNLNIPAPIDDFLEVTLCLNMPNTTMYVQPGQENTSENMLNVNIEEVESREVRLNDLSDILDINEREVGSTWLQIGLESISKHKTRADQP